MRKYTVNDLWIRVVLFFAICTILVFTFQVFVIPLVQSVFNNGNEYPIDVKVNLQRAMNGIVGIGLVYVFLRFDRHRLKVVGFEWNQLKGKEWILVSIPITIIGLVPTIVIEVLFEIISFGNLLDPVTMVMTFIVTFLAIALGEEILFRGYLQSLLETRYSFSIAAIVSAALFGLLHFLLASTGRNLFHMFAILFAAFVIGLALSYTYKVTGYNLILPVAIHGFWDFFLFMFEADFTYGNPLQVIMETAASTVGALLIFWAVKYYADHYQKLTSKAA
jgi:membrane protease YdiL (CAAX protease family)